MFSTLCFLACFTSIEVRLLEKSCNHPDYGEVEMQKYHKSEDGVYRHCVARPGNCGVKGTDNQVVSEEDHRQFSSPKEATFAALAEAVETGAMLDNVLFAVDRFARKRSGLSDKEITLLEKAYEKQYEMNVTPLAYMKNRPKPQSPYERVAMKKFSPSELNVSPTDGAFSKVTTPNGRVLGDLVSESNGSFSVVRNGSDGSSKRVTGLTKREALTLLAETNGVGVKQPKHRVFSSTDKATVDSITRKHFTDGQTGSKFNGAKDPLSVLKSAVQQRGGLDGDDRAELIAAGADPSSFMPPESGVRYLKVATQGVEYMKDTKDMADTDYLYVREKKRSDGKPGSLSFSARVSEGQKVSHATIVIGPTPDENRQPIPGTEQVWTMHPGNPTRGIRSDTVRENGLGDGDRITVGEFRKRFGRDIKANAELI